MSTGAVNKVESAELGVVERSRGERDWVVLDTWERSGAFPRTVGPSGGVRCPARISANFRLDFCSNPHSPQSHRGDEVGG